MIDFTAAARASPISSFLIMVFLPLTKVAGVVTRCAAYDPSRSETMDFATIPAYFTARTGQGIVGICICDTDKGLGKVTLGAAVARRVNGEARRIVNFHEDIKSGAMRLNAQCMQREHAEQSCGYENERDGRGVGGEFGHSRCYWHQRLLGASQ